MEKLLKDYRVTIKFGTILVAVISIVSAVFTIGVAYEKIQARFRHLDAKTSLYGTQFDALETRVSNNENIIANNYIELTTILKSMNENLKDIKGNFGIK